MKQKKKVGSLVALYKDDYFKPEIQIQDSFQFEAFTGDGAPTLYLLHNERVWGRRPWQFIVDRLKYAWLIIKRGKGFCGPEIVLSSKDCFRLAGKLTEFGKWMEKNKWSGKKPTHLECGDCGSRKLTRK